MRARLYSSVMARTDCPICEGSGWKVVERTAAGAQALAAAAAEGGRSVSADDRGNAEQSKMVWAVPCDCTAEDRSERGFARSRIPERYRHCDFDNFETDTDTERASREQLETWNRSLVHAKLMVRRFAEEFASEVEQGLLLMGSCGVGKTHLAVAALKEVVRRGHGAVFYDYREMLKQIQESYNAVAQSTEMSVLEPVLKSELLVLDDVGSSKPSPWALETVGHVLNTRYNEKRATILTTNFFDADAAGGGAAPARMAGGRAPVAEDTLSERVGTRIRSRLYEMCRTVEIYAPDYRKIARDAGFRT
jgi:DNA replication protein DnaC